MIYKVHNREKGYTCIDNSIFQNKNLSLQAKGLLCIMLSLSDNWDFNKKGLMSLSKHICENTFNKVLEELKVEGYLDITQNGLDWQWDVYETPDLKKWGIDTPKYDISQYDSSQYDISQNGGCNKITNNKITNNKITTNKNNNTNLIVAPQREEIVSYCQSKNITTDIIDNFIYYYSERDWCRYDKNLKKNIPLKDWRLALQNWVRNEVKFREADEIKKQKDLAYIANSKVYVENNQFNAKSLKIKKSFEKVEEYAKMFERPKVEVKKNE